MKTAIKNLILPIVLLITLFVAAPALAVEGTCSWHGGVDCSAGPDWDRSAICSDGWSDSGERYFEQLKCESVAMCPQTKWEELSDTYVMKTDRAHFADLIDQINTLNLEYPMIEIRIQEESVGRGITTAGITPQIRGAQKKNRDEVTKLTYEAQLLDKKLRDAQIEINKSCIAIGVAMQKQEALAKEYEYLAPQRAALQKERAAAEVKKIDTGPEMTADARCVKQGLGTFYNTDKQSCDTCSAGTERVIGTNVCQKTLLVAQGVGSAQKPSPPPPVKKSVEIPPSSATTSENIATTSVQSLLFHPTNVLSILPAAKTVAPQRPQSFLANTITAFKSFWAKLFQ